MENGLKSAETITRERVNIQELKNRRKNEDKCRNGKQMVDQVQNDRFEKETQPWNESLDEKIVVHFCRKNYAISGCAMITVTACNLSANCSAFSNLNVSELKDYSILLEQI